MKPVAQWGQNWQNASGRATTAWSEGVASFTGDWAGATVAQEATLLQNVTQAITNGSWRQGVLSTGTGGWKTATQAKAANYGVGYTAGVGNYNAAAQKIAGALQTGLASLPPRGDINQNLQRANALALYMHNLRGQLGA